MKKYLIFTLYSCLLIYSGFKIGQSVHNEVVTAYVTDDIVYLDITRFEVGTESGYVKKHKSLHAAVEEFENISVAIVNKDK